MSENQGPVFISEIIDSSTRSHGALVELMRSRIEVGRTVEEAITYFREAFESIAVKINQFDGKITMTFHSPVFDPIGDVLRWFAERTFTQRSKMSESPKSQTRSYYLEHAVNIVLQLPKKATAGERQCRYVQTGVKMVEEPIYELKCDGDEVPAPAADTHEMIPF